MGIAAPAGDEKELKLEVADDAFFLDLYLCSIIN